MEKNKSDGSIEKLKCELEKDEHPTDAKPCYEIGDTYYCALCGTQIIISVTPLTQPDAPCLYCCETPMIKKE